MSTSAPSTDAALVRGLKRRDDAAWAELYTTYERRLYGFSYRLAGNEHDAADLVQETFLRAIPKIAELPPESANVSAYLFTTARNLFLKGVERGQRQQPVEEVPEPDELMAIEDDPERSTLLIDQQEEVRLANAELAPRQRMVLALRELEGRSYQDIAELAGMNENAVAQLISRARIALREKIRLAQVDTERLAPECAALLPSLSAYLDGQLKGARNEALVAHLATCDDCLAVLDDFREAGKRYRSIAPPAIGFELLRRQIGDAMAASSFWSEPEAGEPPPDRSRPRPESSPAHRSGGSRSGGRRRRRARALTLTGGALLLCIGAAGVYGWLSETAEAPAVELAVATAAEPPAPAPPTDPEAPPDPAEPRTPRPTTPPPIEPEPVTQPTPEPVPVPEPSPADPPPAAPTAPPPAGTPPASEPPASEPPTPPPPASPPPSIQGTPPPAPPRPSAPPAPPPPRETPPPPPPVEPPPRETPPPPPPREEPPPPPRETPPPPPPREEPPPPEREPPPPSTPPRDPPEPPPSDPPRPPEPPDPPEPGVGGRGGGTIVAPPPAPPPPPGDLTLGDGNDTNRTRGDGGSLSGRN